MCTQYWQSETLQLVYHTKANNNWDDTWKILYFGSSTLTEDHTDISFQKSKYTDQQTAAMIMPFHIYIHNQSDLLSKTWLTHLDFVLWNIVARPWKKALVVKAETDQQTHNSSILWSILVIGWINASTLNYVNSVHQSAKKIIINE